MSDYSAMPGEPFPEEIMVHRAKLNTLCSTCFKADVNAKRCEGVSELYNMRKFKVNTVLIYCLQCKLAWYCSKEVSMPRTILQVLSFTFSRSVKRRTGKPASTSIRRLILEKARPNHKLSCAEVEDRGRAARRINSLMTNPLLLLYIQIMLALEFDMVNHPEATRKPLKAHMNVIIEPTTLDALAGLLDGKRSHKKMPGMVQLTRLTSPPSDGVDEPLTDWRDRFWRDSRKQIDAQGYSDARLGLLEVAADNARSGTCFSVHVPELVLDAIRKQETIHIPIMKGSFLALPTTVHECMECVWDSLSP